MRYYLQFFKNKNIFMESNTQFVKMQIRKENFMNFYEKLFM